MDKEFNDDGLDATLRTYLSAELDGQLGRAGQAFQEHLALAHPTTRQRSAGTRSTRSTRAGLWLIGAMGTAVAASVAATMWAVPVTTRPGGNDSVVAAIPKAKEPVEVDRAPGNETPRDAVATSVSTAANWEQVQQVVSSQTVDRGLVLLDDNTPARLVRRVSLEQTEWVDEQRGVRMQAFVPRQEAQLISLDTY